MKAGDKCIIIGKAKNIIEWLSWDDTKEAIIKAGEYIGKIVTLEQQSRLDKLWTVEESAYWWPESYLQQVEEIEIKPLCCPYSLSEFPMCWNFCRHNAKITDTHVYCTYKYKEKKMVEEIKYTEGHLDCNYDDRNGIITRVGSSLCQDCKYNEKTDKEKKVVYCTHKYKEKKMKDTITIKELAYILLKEGCVEAIKIALQFYANYFHNKKSMAFSINKIKISVIIEYVKEFSQFYPVEKIKAFLKKYDYAVDDKDEIRQEIDKLKESIKILENKLEE